MSSAWASSLLLVLSRGRTIMTTSTRGNLSQTSRFSDRTTDDTSKTSPPLGTACKLYRTVDDWPFASVAIYISVTLFFSHTPSNRSSNAAPMFSHSGPANKDQITCKNNQDKVFRTSSPSMQLPMRLFWFSPGGDTKVLIEIGLPLAGTFPSSATSKA